MTLEDLGSLMTSTLSVVCLQDTRTDFLVWPGQFELVISNRWS